MTHKTIAGSTKKRIQAGEDGASAPRRLNLLGLQGGKAAQRDQT